MRNSFRRRLARVLLAFGIRIAPRHARPWGQAMLGELGTIKGEWPALMWAAGGATVLAKHALASLVFPRRDVSASLSGEAFFAKEGPMRKASLITIAACAVLSLSFLLAPAFRQGLGVSLAQWRATFDVTSHSRWPVTNPGFLALARQAEQNHDAEAIAFAAVNIFPRSERTRLAKEAVQLDPRLTWIYARAYPTPSEAWVQKLEKWDPGNALPYFIEAQNIDLAQARSRKFIRNVDQQSEAWKNAMAGAFRSSKFDDYQQKLVELDRKVAARYGLSDPYVVARGIRYSAAMPYYDVFRFGESILESGDDLQARGDLNGALERYLSVIRFEEAVGVPTPELLKHACYKAGALYQKKGNKVQAELLSYLAGNTTQVENEGNAAGRRLLYFMAVVHWYEAVMKISGLLLPIFTGLLLILALTIVLKSRSLRASGRILAVGVISAVGLLFSSALVYVSYRPFGGIVRQFVRTGNDGGLSQLNEFLDYAQFPLFKPGPRYPLHFWIVIIALCVVTLLVIAVRHLHVRPRAKATT
ncbi:MAG TPA: hypothetical protein VGU90_01545 [Terriglobales bacterium]|nr:hypothetical protein [Terriglobales bacterium]